MATDLVTSHAGDLPADLGTHQATNLATDLVTDLAAGYLMTYFHLRCALDTSGVTILSKRSGAVERAPPPFGPSCRRPGRPGQGVRAVGASSGRSPVLLDLEAPLPLEVFVFVVIEEDRLDVVGAAGQHTYRRSAQVSAGQVRSGQRRSGQVWLGPIKSSEPGAGQVRSDQVGQVRSGRHN